MIFNDKVTSWCIWPNCNNLGYPNNSVLVSPKVVDDKRRTTDKEQRMKGKRRQMRMMANETTHERCIHSSLKLWLRGVESFLICSVGVMFFPFTWLWPLYSFLKNKKYISRPLYVVCRSSSWKPGSAAQVVDKGQQTKVHISDLHQERGIWIPCNNPKSKILERPENLSKLRAPIFVEQANFRADHYT